MSDTSGESDHGGYFVQEYDQDESDHDDSHSDPEPAPNRFLDLEAADSDESDAGSDGDDILSDASELHFFPHFKRLPLELRQQIWESFCPDLTAKSRVYWFQLVPQKRQGNAQVWEGPLLEQQTRHARAMLAVHHESRQLALKAFPDVLSFRNHGLIRFNTKRDVVVLGSVEKVFFELDMVPRVPGFSEHIHHLAIESTLLNELGHELPAHLLGAFENLKTVYYSTEPTDHKPEHLRWCTSPQAMCYFVTTFEEELGLGEDADFVYCWPDIENHPSFADKEIPLDGLAEDLLRNGTDVMEAQAKGLKFWPLVQFICDSDMRRFNKLLTWDGEEDIGWGSSGGEDNGEPDVYESDGIDDSDISEDESGNDSDLIVLDHDDDASDSHEEGDEGSEDGSSAIVGSSLAQHRVETIDLTADDDQSAPRFSSPEQSSSTVRESDGSEAGQPASRISRLKRPRGRVVESDSEDDSEQDVPRKRARTESRRTDIVISDDDDEEEERRKMRANRRARAVFSEDDEDDEDDKDEEEERRKIPAHRRARAVISEDDDDEGDSDTGEAQDDGAGGGTDWSGISSSDEEEEPAGGAAIAKPLSLAEKLQLHRDKVPIPPSDDGNSDIEDMAGDDYDALDYADFQDDEEGNEIPQEGDDSVEGGLIMDDEDGEEGDYGY